MSGLVAPDVPCAKGWVCYGFDEYSKGKRHVRGSSRLNEAIMSKAPHFQRLEQVFDTLIFSYLKVNSDVRERIVEYLRTYWFADPNLPNHTFPVKR